jgi:hypothetical protein
MANRSEVMLNEDQVELLDTIAFVKSQKSKKRVTRSALIRECIGYWWEHKGRKEFSLNELVLLNPALQKSMAAAREDLRTGETCSYEEPLKKLEEIASRIYKQNKLAEWLRRQNIPPELK